MKKYSYLLSITIISVGIYASFYGLMPQHYSRKNAPAFHFSTERALDHVQIISQEPHYMGAPYHKMVQEYLISQLKKLGLRVEIQEDYILDAARAFSKPKNIIARIRGTGNSDALLLLSHYDSAPHASPGASDDGSGIATILEGIRAFIASGKKPSNDIIILFSDGEELELSGAELFVKRHSWAKDVKLVLNFEARGSGGPSHTLIETNGGNSQLLEAFKKANVPFPVANSLAYSVYKMMPNDTDLTAFRQDGDIDGFNFAFIDDHYDYHTALDSYENLDRNTLEHQGTYLMSLLNYFSGADLTRLKSTNDVVYFNTPLGLHWYPFSWILPMFILTCIVFGYMVYVGFKNKVLAVKPILIGFALFASLLLAVFAVTHYGWVGLKKLYPSYQEILQGFTYNGHSYIAAFICLAIAICWMAYSFLKTHQQAANYMVGPLFTWLVINVVIVVWVKGAAFFIAPVFIGLLLFYGAITSWRVLFILGNVGALLIVFILAPIVQTLPVGLGLKMMAAGAVIPVLIFGLLLPVWESYLHKKKLALIFFAVSGVFLIKAHISSSFQENRPKPNSLVYFIDADRMDAYWLTYDRVLDFWTRRKLGNNPQKAVYLEKSTLPRRYGTPFSYAKQTSLENIALPALEIIKDSITATHRVVSVQISSKRLINTVQVFVDNINAIETFSANGEFISDRVLDRAKKRLAKLLLNYQVTEQKPLKIILVLAKEEKVLLEVNEISLNLLHTSLGDVLPRPKGMIPKPFVVNDAIMVKKTLQL